MKFSTPAVAALALFFGSAHAQNGKKSDAASAEKSMMSMMGGGKKGGGMSMEVCEETPMPTPAPVCDEGVTVLTSADCGTTLNANTLYVMNDDITCPATGFTMADGVVVDCRGNTLSGPGDDLLQGGFNGFVVSSDNTVIKNCDITGFSAAIFGLTTSSDPTASLLVSGVTASENGTGIATAGTNQFVLTVVDSKFDNNQNTGMDLSLAAATIIDTTANGNGFGSDTQDCIPGSPTTTFCSGIAIGVSEATLVGVQANGNFQNGIRERIMGDQNTIKIQNSEACGNGIDEAGMSNGGDDIDFDTMTGQDQGGTTVVTLAGTTCCSIGETDDEVMGECCDCEAGCA